MNRSTTTHLTKLVLSLALLSSSTFLQAQSAAPEKDQGTSTTTTPGKDEVIALSPFNIVTSRDVGFVAASALAGGRLATDLKDTPAAYSVLTREFIDALNITDLSTAIKWTVDSNNINDDGRGVMFADEQNTKYSFRGVTSNQQNIDFFPVYYDYDSYNLERFDFARGPNSILFGNGSDGGTPNATYKQARLDRPFGQVKLTAGSWRNGRGTVDVNRPITESLALRANALWQDSKGWRDRTFYKKKAAALGLTYAPFKDTNIHFNGDYGKFDRDIALDTLGDRISGWDGVSTYATPIATLPSNANAAGIQRLGSSTAAYPVFIPGLSNLGLVNWANSAATVGGNNNGAVPVGGTLLVGPGGNYAGGPILDSVNLPGNAFGLATKGSQFRLPGRAFSTAVNNESFRQDYDTYTLSLDQKVGDHLFLNAAGNYTDGKKTTDYTTVRGLNDVYIDINQNLPTGAPNPNFLVPYDESVRYKNITNFVSHNYRASAAIVFDKTDYGDFRLNLQVGDNRAVTPRKQYTYVIKDSNLDSRDWPANNLVRYRYYWNQYSRPENDIGNVTYTDPVKGTSTTVPTGFVLDSTRQNNTSRTFSDFKYEQAAFTGKLWHDRINLLGAVRRDDYKSISDQSFFRRDYAAGWDGSTIQYRPRPPGDYFNLTYTPKDANGNATGATTLASARPRDGNGNPLAQYSNDRFLDDYSTPTVKGKVTTYSGGGVVHATDWVSAFYNYAQTFNPPSPALRVNGGVFQPLLSQGWDAGLRFNLLHDKVILNVTRYSARQQNVSLGTGTGNGLPVGLPGAINTIIDANKVGDFSASGINQRGFAEVPGVYSDTASAQTKGWEFEATANPLPGWRVLANIAFPKATQSDAYGDTRSYLAANEGTLKQILSDAGVIVGSNNVASVDNSIPVGQQSPDASAAAAAWNSLQNAKANFVTQSQEVTRLAKITANLFSDYTIQSGVAKNFRFGGGVNYRGKEVIGFRGADTIVDPTNPAAAIDDPNVGPLNPVYRKAYYTATGVLGYTYHLAHGRSIRIDFTVDNLFDESKPLYYNTVQRPPNGDLSNPSRVATPNQYTFQVPRSYSLAATLDF